jgi:uncharacterized damage-inducible protein DinB
MMNESVSQLQRLFAWDDWANRTLLASVATSPQPPLNAVRRMAHIIAVEDLYRARMQDKDTTGFVVWPEYRITELEAHLNRLAQEWRAYFARLDPADLAHVSAYTNSQGQRWENAHGDMLMHLVMHSAYHRGQIAADIRVSGGEPAYTDFIEAVRRGFVK